MKQFFCVAFLMLAVITSKSQLKIKIDEIANHVGDSVNVIAKVYSTYHAKNADNAPTLINLGDNYPNQKLTVVIRDADRKNFPQPPEEYFKNKTVSITGRVELYKGKPQIVISNTDGIKEVTEEKEKKNN